MRISLQWIRDYLDVPQQVTFRSLAEKFTCTTAEVDDVEELRFGAIGLLIASIRSIEPIVGNAGVRKVTLDVGGGRTAVTVSAALNLPLHAHVVYAPDGASVAGYGCIGTTIIAGIRSEGLILPTDALGIPGAAQEAILVSPSSPPGEQIAASMLDDDVLVVDNKSITHRPDLWGHYGIAREMAAMLGVPLKPFPAPVLESAPTKQVPISIAAPAACPRYSALLLDGASAGPSPLWMQIRLARTGQRPINALVDLTNYVMADLGQPMHAFDADRVPGIEVAFARDGERFSTLDGIERVLTSSMLMIQSGGRSVALAGVMGGLESEVTSTTRRVLLESANFEPAGIRKTASALALRTDASARFEKSLDPASTPLAIQRFVALAKPIFPGLVLASELTDRFPNPLKPTAIVVRPDRVARTVGRVVSIAEMKSFLQPLGFTVASAAESCSVVVPSFRSANDVQIEADVIEEIARFVGYGAIESAMPAATIRSFPPHALHELEQRTLEHFTQTEGFHEVHGYVWFDSTWLARIGFDPGACLQLRNPAAQGMERLRTTLIPGLLRVLHINRVSFPSLAIIEIGGAFSPTLSSGSERRSVALLVGSKAKQMDQAVLDRLKRGMEQWIWRRFGKIVEYRIAEPDPRRPWESKGRLSGIQLGGEPIGNVGVLGLPMKRAINERLGAWSVAWAELNLTALAEHPATVEKPGSSPVHPEIEIDYSLLTSRQRSYGEISEQLREFRHPLLTSVSYLGAYEGRSIEASQRSLSFRFRLGHAERTLLEDDANSFRSEVESFLARHNIEVRR